MREMTSLLTSCLEVKDGILLGGNGVTVVRRGMEVPTVERSEKFFIELRSHAVYHRFADNFSTLVNRNLDHHVAFGVRQFPRVNHWIGRSDWKGRTNLVAINRAAGQRSIG